MADDDSIEIDVSKIKNIFRKKPDAKQEIDDVEERIDDGIKEQKIEIKELKEEELEEKEKLEVLQEKKEELDDIKEKVEKEEEKLEIIREKEEHLEQREKKEEAIIDKQEKRIEEIREDVQKIEDDEAVSIDFGKIGRRVKGLFKGEKKEEGDSVNVKDSLGGVSKFFKQNKYALPVLLILIAIFFSTFFRMYPATLPATDDWAEDTIERNYKNQISDQINQQYPNLPSANKNVLIENEYQKVLSEKKDEIDKNIEETSNYFKSRFQDENGDTYLLAIDPYFWYNHARNYVENGHLGDSYKDGESWNSQRQGRIGKPITAEKFHPLLEAWSFKVISVFSGMSLMRWVFFFPVILIGLSIIPAFFIGRKIGGNLGGFFAAMILAINFSLLGRTPAGFSDTDAYNIFFPLFIVWLFMTAFESKDNTKSYIMIGLSSLLTGLYAYTWGGWWYVFGFLMGTVVLYLGYQLVTKKKEIKGSIVKGGLFFVLTAAFVSLIAGWSKFWLLMKGPLRVITLKQVAVTSLWPNVLTTVAEFNKVQLGSIISQMGGRFLFALAIVGILLTMIKKDSEGKRDVKYAIFLTIWFIGTLYGFTKGVRFAILMVPAFAIALGACVGIVYEYLTKWLSEGIHVNKLLSQTIVVILLCLLLISPMKAADRTAKQEIPQMNDAWYGSLTGIRDASEDAIITSWWDFGHWFTAVSERRVTFDGAGQGNAIHWVGKTLVTKSEDTSIGILRMLNCGHMEAYKSLEGYMDGDTIATIDLLNDMFVVDKEEAMVLLEEAGLSSSEVEEVIGYTHCNNLIDQYYITSEDMIGKAGVWGHFGSWSFNRAKMYQSVKSKEVTEGIQILQDDFDLTEEDAENKYYEIQNNEADKWISAWPGYFSGVNGCNVEGSIITCGNGLEVDLTDMQAYINVQGGKAPLKSLSFIDENKEFRIMEYEGQTAPYSAALIPDGNSYKSILTDPLQVGSIFTRLFFFNGHGLEHFELFSDSRQVTGGRIQVWKVDWSGGRPIDIFDSGVPSPEEVKASHILIMTEDRTDEEALELAEEIKDKITDDNFGELAKEYSEGPSAPREGDLGWFGKGQMVKEFEDAAFALEKGKVSDIVKTQFGYHIIKVIDKREQVVVEEVAVEEPEEEVEEEDSGDTVTVGEEETVEEEVTEEEESTEEPAESDDKEAIEFDIEI